MRRGLASLIMGLSLLLATASWTGFIMSRTVLDPGRSERLADTLLDNEEVRAAIVDRLSDSVESQIPAEVPVTRTTIETAADAALEDPRVEALIRDGLVRAHQNALAGNDEPVMIDASALGAAGRDAVVALQPELDAVLPQTPALEVELPSTGLSWLGTVKRYVDRFTLIGGVLALIGVTTAFVLARNRAAALRRVAFWAFGASAFWLIVAYALPWVLERIAPSSVSIASAAIDVFFEAMIRPAITLAVIGVGLLLLSLVWPSIERRRPAAKLDRAGAPSVQAQARPLVASPSSIANQPSQRGDRPVPPQPPPTPHHADGAAYAQQQPAYAPEKVVDYYEPATSQHQSHRQDDTDQFPVITSKHVDTAPRLVPPTPPSAAPPTPPVTTPPPAAPPTPPVTTPPATTPAATTPPVVAPQSPAQSTPGEPAVVGFENIGDRGSPATGGMPVDLDPDQAAEDDDFAADWVEGVGYTESEPRTAQS